VGEQGHAYVAGRMTAGDTKTEALRLLRRRLSDDVFRRLRADEVTRRDVVDHQVGVAA
jgi:transposase